MCACGCATTITARPRPPWNKLPAKERWGWLPFGPCRILVREATPAACWSKGCRRAFFRTFAP
jgi:hypothetical protein